MVFPPRHFTASLASSLIYTRAPYITLEVFKGLRTVTHSAAVLLCQLQTEAQLSQALKHDADVLRAAQTRACVCINAM